MSINSSIVLTIIVYVVVKFLYCHKPILAFSPLLLCPAILVMVLSACSISYEDYYSGNKLLNAMLQPVIVALAIPVYKYSYLLRKHAAEIIVGVVGGSVIAMASAIVCSSSLHLSMEVIGSMAPHSVTTPIAVSLSESTGGIPALTAVFVIITGLTGVVIAPTIVRMFSIKTKVARGLLLGVGAHALGTSKAFELGSVEGAIATLAMVLTGMTSVILAPLLVHSMIKIVAG